MVWGAVGFNFRHLVVFPATKNSSDGPQAYRLTGPAYVRRCLMPIVGHLERDPTLIFQQDGAGCHSNGKRYLAGKKINMITNWPARSPDLSPIETIWSELAVSVAGHHAETREELVAAIVLEWSKLETARINSLVLGFRSRVSKVIKNDGKMS